MRLNKKALGLVVLVALLLTIGATTFSQGGAREIGYVDSQVLLDRYVIPLVEPILTEERETLQSDFDTSTEEMEIEDKRKIFEDYQAQLDERRQILVGAALEEVRVAIQEVAIAEGMDVVLDNQVVLFGGRDLTGIVLEQLIQ